MRSAAIDLCVSAAERAETLEGPDQPEGQTGLLAPGAAAHHAIRALFCQRASTVGYDRNIHVSDQRLR